MAKSLKSMSFTEIIEFVKENAKKLRLSPEDIEAKQKLKDANAFCKENDLEGLYQEGRNLARLV